MQIRTAHEDELARVGDLTAQAYLADGLIEADHDYVDELRSAVRRAHEATVLVAVESGAVVGTVTLTGHGSEWAEVARDGEAEIRMLAVDPLARGRGVGERLVVAAVDAARERGARAFVLSSLEEMRTAHRIYERLGMVRVPERDWSVEGYRMRVYSLALAGHGPAGSEEADGADGAVGGAHGDV
ncbi:GNAT family N-acetyltransferase [Cellulomonas sp. APG4]|uniref:GNAT family N-acetyltransferase n=1 Tax=Cellulomonas sp. APG4 TaxID=1538656 RepID=UPI00137B53C8|nr:GNAT family N-acetyltransferase [Cellulomonas sp. APG4]NCT90657.1 GNAT family N-acetyltransferase [Cellulomonas sp. APG4]